MSIIQILELKKDSGMYFGIAMIFLFAIMALPLAFADDLKGKGVGIVIERSCLMSDRCLDYKDIKSYDNSIVKYSGGFIKSGDDIKRKSAPYQNSLAFYQYDKQFRIFVDPPSTVRDKLPLISIVSSLDQYHRIGQFEVKEIKNTTLKDNKAFESKRVYSHSWYVDPTCTNGIITAKNYTVLLPSMIEHLKSGCQSPMVIDNTTPDIKKITQHDYTTSSKYKLEQFYKSVKECSKVKNDCKDLINKQVITRPDSK